MTKAPVFHVNADDPDAVVRAARLAFEYRERFGRDVVIDLICYRRRGHNEADDPSMTQPKMYQDIDALPSTRTLYAQDLVGRGDVSQEEADEVLDSYHSKLDAIFVETQSSAPAPAGAHVSGLELPAAQQNTEVVTLARPPSRWRPSSTLLMRSARLLRASPSTRSSRSSWISVLRWAAPAT